MVEPFPLAVSPGVNPGPASGLSGRGASAVTQACRLGLPCPWAPLQSLTAAASRLVLLAEGSRRLPWGSSPFGDSSSGDRGVAVCLTATIRSRRSYRPQRFEPACALWPCFMPQPPMGFGLQRVPHSTSLTRLPTCRASLPLLRRLPAFSRLRGFAPVERPFIHWPPLGRQRSRCALDLRPLRGIPIHALGLLPSPRTLAPDVRPQQSRGTVVVHGASGCRSA